MKYILDSNCFITPHRTYCPIDVAVNLWQKIRTLAERGIIFTLDKVKEEICSNDDELQIWVKENLATSFCLKFEGEAISKLPEIIKWANDHPFYNSKAKSKYLKMDKADIYLTCFASVSPNDWTIVSMEKSAPNSSGEIKLPDACQVYNIRCISLETMFRELKETF